MDAALKAADYSSMTPEEQEAFRAAYKPFFDAMLDLGVKNRAELKQMLGISDEPASAPGEIMADREADAAPQEPDAPPASAGAGSEPGFTWDDAPESPDTDLPKPLKAPPLKKGGAKKTPPAKRRGKKPESE